MISLAPVANFLPAPNEIQYEYPAVVPPESPTERPNVHWTRKFVDPPEMPDAVKAEASKGSTCYYGFYFPDDVIHAFNKAHNVDCPAGQNLRDWTVMRKRHILNNASSALGIRISTTLEQSLTRDHDDFVFFAYLTGSKFAKSMCPPDHTIKELMTAVGVEGEPQWIVA